MTFISCPTCGGHKTVSKPPYIAGDVNQWVGSGTVMYSCPTCNGRGWIDTDTNAELIVLKSATLSVMETSENLMTECAKRADRIKELEEMIDRKNSRIVNIISKCQCREEELEFLVSAMDFKIDDLKTQLRITKNARSRSSDDGKLLDDILEIVDTVIERNTEFSHILHTTYNAEQMRDVCDVVSKFRRENNIVG